MELGSKITKHTRPRPQSAKKVRSPAPLTTSASLRLLPPPSEIADEMPTTSSNVKLAIVQHILQREECIAELVETVRHHAVDSALLLSFLPLLRLCTLAVVEAIASWKRIARDRSYLWHGTNYLLKLRTDTDFMDTVLAESVLGLPTLCSNPFFTSVDLTAPQLRRIVCSDKPKDDMIACVARRVRFGEDGALPSPELATRVVHAMVHIVREELQVNPAPTPALVPLQIAPPERIPVATPKPSRKPLKSPVAEPYQPPEAHGRSELQRIFDLCNDVTAAAGHLQVQLQALDEATGAPPTVPPRSVVRRLPPPEPEPPSAAEMIEILQDDDFLHSLSGRLQTLRALVAQDDASETRGIAPTPEALLSSALAGSDCAAWNERIEPTPEPMHTPPAKRLRKKKLKANATSQQPRPATPKDITRASAAGIKSPVVKSPGAKSPVAKSSVTKSPVTKTAAPKPSTTKSYVKASALNVTTAAPTLPLATTVAVRRSLFEPIVPLLDTAAVLPEPTPASLHRRRSLDHRRWCLLQHHHSVAATVQRWWRGAHRRKRSNRQAALCHHRRQRAAVRTIEVFWRDSVDRWMRRHRAAAFIQMSWLAFADWRRQQQARRARMAEVMGGLVVQCIHRAIDRHVRTHAAATTISRWVLRCQRRPVPPLCAADESGNAALLCEAVADTAASSSPVILASNPVVHSAALEAAAACAPLVEPLSASCESPKPLVVEPSEPMVGVPPAQIRGPDTDATVFYLSEDFEPDPVPTRPSSPPSEATTASTPRLASASKSILSPRALLLTYFVEWMTNTLRRVQFRSIRTRANQRQVAGAMEQWQRQAVAQRRQRNAFVAWRDIARAEKAARAARRIEFAADAKAWKKLRTGLRHKKWTNAIEHGRELQRE
ncbi:hypothetical protein ACHHYP_14421 [Achlya hypogyna]|uniref:Uncharacterized protein n=1 Tax=Achlya hypogyna TaxID=1202772 RepID=A0A1V9YD79_ACHHY|nr:hypothetical protein ACHHYP_14421 [Achlya hypogyna]